MPRFVSYQHLLLLTMSTSSSSSASFIWGSMLVTPPNSLVSHIHDCFFSVKSWMLSTSVFLSFSSPEHPPFFYPDPILFSWNVCITLTSFRSSFLDISPTFNFPTYSIWVIPCQIIRWFPRTSSDSFEIWHTCRNCLENNIRQIFFYLGQARSEIWPCEKMEKWGFFRSNPNFKWL